MTFHIGLDEIESTAMIAAAASHLPVGASLGKILAVSGVGILCDGGTFGLDERGGVSRIIHTPGGLSEVTRWVDGIEVGRQVLRPDE